MEPFSLIDYRRIKIPIKGKGLFPRWEQNIPSLGAKYSLRGNFKYSKSIFNYSDSIAIAPFWLIAVTFPAVCHSTPCCLLDTSLLSAGDQGAEHRSASKVTAEV
jgi:hypothetical protein